jgi:hypothetical protein
MKQLTNEDIKNILMLINRVTDIKGSEALPIAVIQSKLQSMLEEPKPQNNVESTPIQQPEATA